MGTVRLSGGSDYKVPTIPGTYLEYYNSIYESIRNRNKLIIEAEEALNTIKIIEAAIESNLKNKPVQL
jgi:scyllo-inositol 2-dehydrogenase (NADP+)